MVRPTLEYASTCWDPHSKDLIEDIEQVQKRAARFVCNNYRSKEPGCVTNMLNTLNWEPLSQRRAKNRVTMLYKIINNQVTIDPNTYLNKSDTRTRGEHTRIPACGCIFHKILYLASQSFDFERTVFAGGYSTNETFALNRIHFFLSTFVLKRFRC
jgi:hypothetical protein